MVKKKMNPVKGTGVASKYGEGRFFFRGGGRGVRGIDGKAWGEGVGLEKAEPRDGNLPLDCGKTSSQD